MLTFPLALVLGALPAATIAQNPVGAVPAGLRILVPAYFYPVAGSPWDRLDAAAEEHPSRIAAIGNPASGPGTVLDPTYADTFADFRARGGILYAYVHSSYATRPLAEVEADVDAWLAWYPVDGFFVDEMANVPGQAEAYYRALFLYIRSKQPRAFVIANPGISAPESYLVRHGKRVNSALTIYETDTGFLAWQSDAWVKTWPRSNFAALPYAVPANQWMAFVDHAWDQNCGWIFATDDVLPNPWDTLPPWFEALADYVESKG